MIARELSDEQTDTIEAKAAEAAEQGIGGRIWKQDDTVWGPAGQEEVSNRLGWLDIANRLFPEADELTEFARRAAQDGMTDVVLLGMGGSSLAPEVLRTSTNPVMGFLRLHVLDSTDAGAVARTMGAVDLHSTLVLVSTKSGGTIETLSAFKTFWEAHPKGEQFVAITDPGSALVSIAEEHGFRRTFLNDENIGGRYSALSYFGLVPAALIGLDVGELLSSAIREAEACAGDDPEENEGLWLGCALGALAEAGRDKLTWIVDEPFGALGLWLEQLVAESTGKEGKGILPIADEPLGAPDQYGEDRVFVHVENAAVGHDEHAAKLAALAAAGHPVLKIVTDGTPTDLGRLFFLSEYAVAAAGWALGINPYDQPNVAEAKAATSEVLEELQKSGELASEDDGAVETVLDGVASPSYVAIMGYVEPSKEFDAAIAELRVAIRERTGCATTFGYGPRFLHSTGQLHKGGPATGRFLQLVHPVADDVKIPGTSYGFETLKAAQATGDLRTLRAHDLPAERVTLDGDPVTAVHALTSTIKGGS
ncbi:MAG: glucose-6-phosphate isomerase [Solirubrobacterales bacterium]|nr:glucose-6-phosphate isomerase [Solirubrobacterales bacterium]